MDEKYVFGPYYHKFWEEAVAKDDETTNMILYVWNVKGMEKKNKQRENSKVYELCPLDSLYGLVIVAQLNPLVQLRHLNLTYKETPVGLQI